MNKYFKRALGIVLALALAVSTGAGALAAVDLGITWPASWGNGAPAWAVNATQAQKDATIKAINDEYNAQLDSGYNLGGVESFSSYGNVINVQFSGADSDNVGNPWGHEGRKWGAIIAPYSGMAFSLRGYYAVSFGNFRSLLSNEFEWTNPDTGVTRVYQMTSNGALYTEVGGNTVYALASFPGIGATNNVVKEAMKYAYAESAYNGFILGITAAHAGMYGDYTYQEFFGPDSTGASAQANRGLDKNYGISYMVAKSDSVYIVSGDIFTAWATTWNDLDSTNPDRFSVSGVPTSNAYTDADGNLRQDFEKITIVVDKNTAEATVIPTGLEILSITGETVKSSLIIGDDINLMIKKDESLETVTLDFELPAGATANRESGSDFNLSSDAVITLTNAVSGERSYTLHAFSENDLTVTDRLDAGKTQVLIDAIPEYIYVTDIEAVNAAVDSYNSLNMICKLWLTGLDKLTAAQERLALLGDTSKIRVTCVGDSITEGIGGSSGNSYPDQLQRKLGSGYAVTNAGVSGSTAIENCDLSGITYVDCRNYGPGLTSDPDIVIMMLGTNDATTWCWESTKYNAPEEFRQGYSNLIEAYQSLPSDPKIFICYPLYTYDDAGDHRTTNNENGTMPIIDELAEKYGLEILDMHSFTKFDDPDYAKRFFPDNLHPCDWSYGLLADEFAKYVTAACEGISEVEVGGILLNGEPIADFDPETKQYTVDLDSYEFPEITISSGNGKKYDLTVTPATVENPVSNIYVESEFASYGVTYVVKYELPKQEVKLGDLTGDGGIDVSDVVALRQIIMSDTWTAPQLAAGDVDENGTLNVSDVVMLRTMIMNA